MIKKALIVNTPTVENPHAQYLMVEFTDGAFVNLNEEELKNAVLADPHRSASGGDRDERVKVNGSIHRDCTGLHHDD